MKLTILAAALAFAIPLSACKGKGPGAEPAPATDALVRVKVPEAKCEVAIPSNMVIAGPKASGFTIVEKGKDPDFHGMLIVIMPVGPMGSLAPPDATEVKTLKDKTNPDGSVEREGSYKNAVQTLHTAEYAYPIGKEWLYCQIAAAKPERRDQVAKLCSGLAPIAL
jgi:hypothetical protein